MHCKLSFNFIHRLGGNCNPYSKIPYTVFLPIEHQCPVNFYEFQATYYGHFLSYTVSHLKVLIKKQLIFAHHRSSVATRRGLVF